MTEQNIWLAYVITNDDPEIVGVFQNKGMAVLAMFDYLYGTDRIFSQQRERYELGKISLLRDNQEDNLSNIIQSCQDYDHDDWWSYVIKKQPVISENKAVNAFRMESEIDSDRMNVCDELDFDTSDVSDIEVEDDGLREVYEYTWNETCDDVWDEVCDNLLDNTGWEMVEGSV